MIPPPAKGASRQASARIGERPKPWPRPEGLGTKFRQWWALTPHRPYEYPPEGGPLGGMPAGQASTVSPNRTARCL